MAVGKTAGSVAQAARPVLAFRPVRVLTLNLWGDNGPAGDRLAALAAYLRDERFDVVALQEVEGPRGATQAHGLAAAAGYPTVCATRTGRGLRRGEGLAVLAAGDAAEADTVALPSAITDHPRAVQLVDFPAFGSVVRVANTHLAWRLDAGDVRAAQAAAIRDELAGWTGRAVLAGDLNDVRGSPALATLADAGFVDALTAARAEERPTFDRANPYLWQPELAGRRVDHVLVRGLAVADAGVVLDGVDTPVVSDHYGVRATLRDAAAG